MLWILLFIICLSILVWSSEKFIYLAGKAGKALGISSFVVGITIVAMGTSLPELLTSIIAILKDSGEIVVGNVIGSNITNIFLVIGTAAIVMPNIDIDRKIIRIDFPILLLTAFSLAVLLWIHQDFNRTDAFIFLAAMGVFLVYIVKSGSKELIGESTDEASSHENLIARQWVMLVLSGALIFYSAKYMVVSIIEISAFLHLGKDIIALSAVALGTSLPELAVSIAAARKKQGNMIIGNIIGSNIFNTLLVMGIPGLIRPFDIQANIFYFSLPVMIVATLFFFLFAGKRKLSKFNGITLVFFYILYLAALFIT